ncbi:phosphotransferase [Kitasatospora sp. NPDC002551]|uniref:phosphotransferase n=1 Tax=Kitasatospora sp. NPDC002551 TaxID=3154539 RepID=UPI003325B7DF
MTLAWQYWARASPTPPRDRRRHRAAPPTPPRTSVPAIPLGYLAPFVRLAAQIDGAATLDDEQRQWLRDRLAELESAWSSLPPGMPASVIHGDAWGGNVAVTPTTTYLLDFDSPPSGLPNGTSPPPPSAMAPSAPFRTASPRRSARRTALT